MAWEFMPFGILAGHNAIFAELFAVLVMVIIVGLVICVCGLFGAGGEVAGIGIGISIVVALIATGVWTIFLTHAPSVHEQALFQHAELLLIYRNLILAVALVWGLITGYFIDLMITEDGRYTSYNRMGIAVGELAIDLVIALVLVAVLGGLIIGALAFHY